MKTIKLKLEGMHCSSCALAIDGELEDTPGVVSAKTSYAKSETEVLFDPEKTGEEKIRGIIATLGYKIENP